MRAPTRSNGFTLIEILIVVLIIGIISLGVLLSVNLTGRDHELEKESDRLLTLVNYAREQAELQTREYGVIFNADGYQFVAYDARRGLWREIYEDDSLRLRKIPDGLDFKLSIEGRPVVLVPASAVKKPDPKKDPKNQVKSLKDVTSLQDASSASAASSGSSGLRGAPISGKALGDSSSSLEDQKPIQPQVMIYSNGDLTSFEISVEREGGVRSVTLSQDEKGQFVAKPMVEKKS